MKKSGHRITVPRPVAVFLPPVLALILAVIYHQWQAGKAGDEAAALCARFNSGGAIDAFVREALAADFEVRDDGRDSKVVIASKEVFRLQRESYRCTVRHDGARILAADAGMVVVD